VGIDPAGGVALENSDLEERHKENRVLSLIGYGHCPVHSGFVSRDRSKGRPSGGSSRGGCGTGSGRPGSDAPHPHIDEALESMRAAKHHLEAAEHEFHGHRAKAIEHLDMAIHQAEECLREP